MIYEHPEATAPIRQGDIFVGLPRIDIDLNNFLLFDELGPTATDWDEVATEEKVSAVVPVKPVSAIVITQDCDALRSKQITLCEIRPFETVEGQAKPGLAEKSFVGMITKQARQSYKWFYLPADAKIGFNAKMGVDFQVTLSILREDLEKRIGRRVGRLNPVADEHFRERLSEYFRRYPYDEWYPFTKAEFAEYAKIHSASPPQPFEYQK